MVSVRRGKAGVLLCIRQGWAMAGHSRESIPCGTAPLEPKLNGRRAVLVDAEVGVVAAHRGVGRNVATYCMTPT